VSAVQWLQEGPQSHKHPGEVVQRRHAGGSENDQGPGALPQGSRVPPRVHARDNRSARVSAPQWDTNEYRAGRPDSAQGVQTRQLLSRTRPQTYAHQPGIHEETVLLPLLQPGLRTAEIGVHEPLEGDTQWHVRPLEHTQHHSQVQIRQNRRNRTTKKSDACKNAVDQS